MTWTRVSCYLVCACISWFTHCLISHVSLVVVVLVSHLVQSLRRVKCFFLDQGFSCGDRFSESVLSNCTADLLVGL